MQIMGARNLLKQGRGIPSPFVEVECAGQEIDSQNRYKTATRSESFDHFVKLGAAVPYTWNV